MATIVTRVAKGSPLTHVEVDTNFTNLNTAKLENLAAAAGAGSAAAPSISFAADTNTGAFNPAADTFAFATNGVERLRITSAGLLGIGTSSPAEILDVNGNFVFGTSFAGRIRTKNAGGGSAAGTIEISAPNETTTRGVSFGNNYYITASNTYAQTATNLGGSAIEFRANNVNYGEILFRQKQDPDLGGAERTPLIIDSAGNVGIGTTSPSHALDVNGVIRSDGTSGGLYFGGNSTTPAVGSAIHRPAADTLAFVTASTERARIDSSGRLLVGTSTAGNGGTLSVNGTSSIGGGSTGAQSSMSKIGMERTSSVTTSAKTIFTDIIQGLSSAAAAHLMVYGNNDAGAGFMDVVAAKSGGSVAVISSSTIAGSPAARTYTMSGASLQLQMASQTHNTNVRCTSMGLPF